MSRLAAPLEELGGQRAWVVGPWFGLGLGLSLSLLEVPASRQWFRTIKHADIVESQESTRKDILPPDILSVDPPCEIQKQFLKYTG